MNSRLRKKLICLIHIYNAAAKLTLYDTSPENVNMLDTSFGELLPYHKYWTQVDPKIGVIKLNKPYR